MLFADGRTLVEIESEQEWRSKVEAQTHSLAMKNHTKTTQTTTAILQIQQFLESCKRHQPSRHMWSSSSSRIVVLSRMVANHVRRPFRSSSLIVGGGAAVACALLQDDFSHSKITRMEARQNHHQQQQHQHQHRRQGNNSQLSVEGQRATTLLRANYGCLEHSSTVRENVDQLLHGDGIVALCPSRS